MENYSTKNSNKRGLKKLQSLGRTPYSRDTVGDETLSTSLWYLFFFVQSAQVLTFIFRHLFYFIRLTTSSSFLLPSKYNISGSMGVTTGFPSMGPLYICLYYFTIAATSFSPNLLIPVLAYICVNMAFFFNLHTLVCLVFWLLFSHK